MSHPFCPRCGSEDTREFLYGYPPRQYDKEKYVLGGDVLWATNPLYFCVNCEKHFGLMAAEGHKPHHHSQYTIKWISFKEKSKEGSMEISFMEEGIEAKVILPPQKAYEDFYTLGREEWLHIRLQVVNELFLLDWEEDPAILVESEDVEWELCIGFVDDTNSKLQGDGRVPHYYSAFKEWLKPYIDRGIHRNGEVLDCK